MSVPAVAEADAIVVEGIEKKVAAAENKVAAAENKVAAAGTDIELKATANSLLKVALEGLQTAQDGVKSAQKVLDDANDGLIAANKLARQASQRLLDTTSAGAAGGYEAASGQGAGEGGAEGVQGGNAEYLVNVLASLQARMNELQHGQTELYQRLEHLTPVDPWELLSTNSTKSQKHKLRENLKAQYAGQHNQVTCIVSGVVDDQSRPDQERVVAAHLWPKSCASEFAAWRSGHTDTSCIGIDDAVNGLLLLKDIEEAYDSKRVCFLCDPFKVELVFRVLDPRLLETSDSGVLPSPRGGTVSYSALNRKKITSPDIDKVKRPSFQILSFHALLSVQAVLGRRAESRVGPRVKCIVASVHCSGLQL